jgi:hypothetical protein
MEALPINPSPEPLRVGAVIQEACRFSWTKRQVLWPWIVHGAVLGGLAEVIGPFGEMLREGGGANPLARLFLLIIGLGWAIGSVLVLVLLAVFCHRAVLLPDVRDTSPLKIFFTARERKFFAWGIGVCLLVAVLVGLSSVVLLFVSEVVGEGLMFVGPLMLGGLFWYLFGRWSLVFPSIALDLSMDIGWSWKQTRGNGWRMLVLVGFLPLTTASLAFLLSYAVPADFPLVPAFGELFAAIIVTPIEVAVVSIAFRELTNWVPAALLAEVPLFSR